MPAEQPDNIDLRAGNVVDLRERIKFGEPGQHHHSHHGETDPRISAQFLACVVGNHQRQEIEHASPGEIEELPGGGQFGARISPVADHTQRAHQRHEGDDQRGTQQRAKDWTEGIAQIVEETIKPAESATRPLAGFRSLHIGIACSPPGSARSGLARAHVLHLGQRHDVVVDALNSAADHHLIAVSGLRHRAHHAGNRLHPCAIDARVVAQLEPQSGGAMGEGDDVVRPADGVKNLGWGIHILCHGASFMLVVGRATARGWTECVGHATRKRSKVAANRGPFIVSWLAAECSVLGHEVCTRLQVRATHSALSAPRRCKAALRAAQ